jgi:transcriptional regulator with XRE-family HTH domain
VEPVYARYGHELQRLRRQRKLSQADLARLVDPTGERLSRSSIANIENGKQRVALHLFLELARVLKIDPRELLPILPEAMPPIVERVPNLTAPEQDWLTRVVAKPPRRRRVRTHGT